MSSGTMPASRSYRDRLLAIYEASAPSKAHQVDALLHKYKGREEALIAAAAQKYNVKEAALRPSPSQVHTESPRKDSEPKPAPPTTGTSSTEHTPSYHDRLKRIYEKYTQRRVPFVDRDLAKYPGREEDVIRAAVKKYGPEPTSSPTRASRGTEGESTDGASPPETARTRAESEAQPDYRARVTELYAQHAPQRLPRVEHEMVKYKGREEALIRAIEAKYVKQSLPPPPPSPPIVPGGDGNAFCHAETSHHAVKPEVTTHLPEASGVTNSDVLNAVLPPNDASENVANDEERVPEKRQPPPTKGITPRAAQEGDCRTGMAEPSTQPTLPPLTRVDHESSGDCDCEQAGVDAIEATEAEPSQALVSPLPPPPTEEETLAEDASSLPKDEGATVVVEVSQAAVPEPVHPAPAEDSAEKIAELLWEEEEEPPGTALSAQSLAVPAPERKESRVLAFVHHHTTPSDNPTRGSESPDDIRDSLEQLPGDFPSVPPMFTISPAAAVEEEHGSSGRPRSSASSSGSDSNSHTSRVASDVDPPVEKGNGAAVTPIDAEETPLPLIFVTPSEANGPSLTAMATADRQKDARPLPPPSAHATPFARTPEVAPADNTTPTRKTEFTLPRVLIHDVFSSLGTTTLAGVDMVSRATCFLLLTEAFGIELHKNSEPSSDVSAAVEKFFGGDFVSEQQFSAFLHTYGASHYWTDREAAYHVRRSEVFLKKCQNALLAMEVPGTFDTGVAGVSPSERGHPTRPFTPQEMPVALLRELRSGFWLHYCIFPCVLPAWKRRWAFVNASNPTTTSPPAGRSLPSRLVLCNQRGTKVDLTIPFDKVVRCFLEAAVPRDGAAAAGGTSPPPCYRKNGLIVRLADGPNPLELRLCCEDMRHSQGILKSYQVWHKTVTAVAKSGEGPSAPHSVGSSVLTPSPQRNDWSSMYTPGEVSTIASDPVLRALTWIKVWVSQNKEDAACADLDAGQKPQLFAWAFYNGRLLHTKLSKPKGGKATSPSARTRSWNVAEDAERVISVDELPMKPPVYGKSFYPFVIYCGENGRCVYGWADTRAERGTILVQLKRLQLHRKLLSSFDLTPSSGRTVEKIERALSYSPSVPAGGTR